MAKVVLLVVAALAIGVGCAVWMSLVRGFSARDKPSPHEAMMARMARHYATPRSMRDAVNPVRNSPEILSEARAHWADHCATCHGNDGKGRTQIGRNLYPPAPDMTLADTQSLSDGELFSIIENGIRLTGMPGWGDGSAESARESWQLVHFIRHLPELSADELVEMETLNPRSPAEFERMKAEQEFLEGAVPPQGVAPEHEQEQHHH
jgi:mono/diheme cytochrome c family protein